MHDPSVAGRAGGDDHRVSAAADASRPLAVRYRRGARARAAARAGARERRRTAVRPLLCALAARARSHPTAPRCGRWPPTGRWTPTTRTCGAAATSTPRRSSAATGSTQLSAGRLTLAAIGELIAGQAQADRDAGLDWSTIAVPPACLDEPLRRAHARLAISLDDPAIYAHRGDQRHALSRTLGVSGEQADDLSRWVLAHPDQFDARRSALLADRLPHLA